MNTKIRDFLKKCKPGFKRILDNIEEYKIKDNDIKYLSLYLTYIFYNDFKFYLRLLNDFNRLTVLESEFKFLNYDLKEFKELERFFKFFDINFFELETEEKLNIACVFYESLKMILIFKFNNIYISDNKLNRNMYIILFNNDSKEFISIYNELIRLDLYKNLEVYYNIEYKEDYISISKITNLILDYENKNQENENLFIIIEKLNNTLEKGYKEVLFNENTNKGSI